MRGWKLRLLIEAVLFAGWVLGPARAQVSAGQINGTITDTTGAVLANASIEANDLATGRQYSTHATDAGTYLMGSLPIGNYRVTIEAPGFKRYVVDSVTVLTGSATTVDAQMQLGSNTEQVTVTGALAPLMQTNNAEVSTVLEQRAILDLPLQLGGPSGAAASGRRQIENFVFLTPGVTGNQWSKSFEGSADFSQEAIIDGLPHPFPETPGFIARTSPPYEAVQEFKVSGTLFPAEYGRGFGVVNYTLKSGTNGYHGDGFYLVRNDAFDARGFFSIKKPPVRQNNFGGTFSGPVRKNKTFFFFSYEEYRLRGAPPFRGLVTLPTPKMRTGDFSELLSQGIQIYDPATTRSNGAGGFTRDPFPGNIIPSNRVSPIANRLYGLMPAPDYPGLIVNNFVSRVTNPGTDRVVSWKVDHRFSDRHSLNYSTWWAWQVKGNYGDFGGGQPLDSGFDVLPRGGGIRVNYDWIISPQSLNHLAAGMSNNYNRRQIGNIQGNQILQIPGLPTDVGAMPTFNVTGLPTIGNGYSVPLYWNNWTSLVSDSFSRVWGKHQMKFGGEYWEQYYNDYEQEGVLGALSFINLQTSKPDASNFGSQGNSVASLELGQVNSANRVISPPHVKYRSRYLAFYFQDSAKLTSKLTLNLGLRWELAWPFKDKTGQMSAVDLTAPNPGSGNRPGAYIFGSDQVTAPLDKRDWGPRLGLAYQFNDKTVARMGYGLIYAQTNAAGVGNYQFGNLFYAGWTGFQNLASVDNGITPAFLLDRGYPAYAGKLPNLDPTVQNGGNADFMPRNAGRQAYTQNWQVDIQRDLAHSIYVNVAYVGNKGTRLPSRLENYNQVPASYLVLGPLLQASINSPQAQAAGIPLPYPGFTGSVAQALRPFPQYLSIIPWSEPIGNSVYDSLQVKVQKRFSDGLSFLVSYTLSKSITDTALAGYASSDPVALDTSRRYLERSLAPTDIPNNLITSWVYTIPAGKHSHGAVAALVKGWETGVVTRYSSGTPLAISGGPPLPLFGAANRPSPIPGVSKRTAVTAGSFDPSRNRYLNASAWALPAPFTFGTGPRVEPNLRGFSYFDEDLSLIKRTFVPKISEQCNIEFRAEFFNIFNRVQFANSAADTNNPVSFGTVASQANQPRNVQFMLKIGF